MGLALGRARTLAAYPFRFMRSQRPKGRKGQRCKIIERKHSNLVGVEFRDGSRYIVDRNALEKV